MTEFADGNLERKSLADAARLTLGYIYFELSDFDMAIKYLSQISTDFYDYPDALLALGWSLVKSENYQSALTGLRRLVSEYPDYYNLEEAHFLIGQCYLKLSYYDFAISEFNKVIDTVTITRDTSMVNRAKQDLTGPEEQTEKLKADLLVLESKLLDLIPLRMINDLPDSTKVLQRNLQQKREALTKQVLDELQKFQTLNKQIDDLQKRIEKAGMQKDWRSYAEYGKARALYLKNVDQQ